MLEYFFPKLYVYIFYYFFPNYYEEKTIIVTSFIKKVIYVFSYFRITYYLIVWPIKWFIVMPIKYIIVLPIFYFFYLVKMSLLYSISNLLSLFFFITRSPYYIAWDPIALRELNKGWHISEGIYHGSFTKYENIPWGPHIPFTLYLPYEEMIDNPEWMRFYKLGYEWKKDFEVQLIRNVSPQFHYAHPKYNRISRWNHEIITTHREFIETVYGMNPNDVVFYHRELRILGWHIAKWNIQVDFTFLGYEKVDFILFLLTVICALFTLLLYFIFYHLGRYDVLVGRTEFWIEDKYPELLTKFKALHANHYLGKPHRYMKKEKLFVLEKYFKLGKHYFCYPPSAAKLNYRWNEMNEYSDGLFNGQIFHDMRYSVLHFCTELIVLMFIVRVLKVIYSYYDYYIHNFYCLNEYFFTYIFMYVGFFGAVYHYFKMKMDFFLFLYRWEETDYYFSHLMMYYFTGVFVLNYMKMFHYELDEPCPIFWYSLVWHGTIKVIFFDCDSDDRFMGWEQGYRIDLFYRHTMEPIWHWWWPREEYLHHWYWFYMEWLYPPHKVLTHCSLYIVIPVWKFIWVPYIRLINYINVKIHNKYFTVWNTPRFTIDEIRNHWYGYDRTHNHVVYERNKHRSWLIIL